MIGLFLLLGGLMGHLLDLSLDRSYSDEPLLHPLHRCPACHSSRVEPLFLVPILGYLRYRGRCPACGERLPRRALFLPLGGAVLFSLAFLAIDGTGAALLSGFFATLFLALAVTDLERRLIPNRIVYPALLLAAALAWAWPDTDNVISPSWQDRFVGGGTAFVLMVGLYLLGRGALGFGDVKMAALMGLVVGLGAAILGLLLATFTAAALVAVLMALRILHRRDYIPYGPFIALGAIIAILWGGPIVDWYRG
ncbi:MAG: prepilin peptidase [Dehalococcoidia bacterium]